jgi:hypothetical protein
MADQKLTPTKDMFEEYLVGPDGESDPAHPDRPPTCLTGHAESAGAHTMMGTR